jgi:hypothetical protein
MGFRYDNEEKFIRAITKIADAAMIAAEAYAKKHTPVIINVHGDLEDSTTRQIEDIVRGVQDR